MSKQMTREEAVEILSAANRQLYNKQVETPAVLAAHVLQERTTALSILAPEPRTEPPGVDEVGDDEIVLCWNTVDEQWFIPTGGVARHYWGDGISAWLPIEALPKATDGTATFEKGEG